MPGPLLYIYILKLESDKYYVGKTFYPDNRISDHFNNNGSEWTKIYKPIEVVEIINNCESYDEDKYTIKYMESKGIENVRGGTFSQVKLPQKQIDIINIMIKSANDNCFSCGQYGHFIQNFITNKVDEFIKENIHSNNIIGYLEKIKKINDEVIVIKYYIDITNTIKFDDMEESKNFKEKNKLITEMNQIQYLNKKGGELMNKIQSYKLNKKNIIDDIYSKIYEVLTYNNGNSGYENKIIMDNKSPEIKAQEIIRFNLSKKQRLDSIFKEYHSEEYIETLLSKLYEMLI